MVFSLNPAIAIGLLVGNQSENAWDAVWPHLIGPLFGSFMAWGCFALTNEEDAARAADDRYFDAVKRPFTEFIGTFFITLVVSLIAAGTSPLAGFAIGGAVMGLHFGAMPVSGGHFNPAITFGVWLSNRDLISNWRTCVYIAAQFAGGVLAAVLATYLTGATPVPMPLGAGPRNVLNTYLVQVIFGMVVVFGVLVATTVAQTSEDPTRHEIHGHCDNDYYGYVYVGARTLLSCSAQSTLLTALSCVVVTAGTASPPSRVC